MNLGHPKDIVIRVARSAPIPLSGLMLGLASAGNMALEYRWFFGVFAITILAILLLKLTLDRDNIREELGNHAIIGIMCTFPMATSILSLYLIPSMPVLAYGVWAASVVLHLTLILHFTLRFLPQFKVSMTLPSYFVVYVGIAVNGYIAPVHGHPVLGQAFFWFGFLTLLLLMPPLFYRAFVMRTVPVPLVPTMAIFTAPSSLVLVAYFDAYDAYVSWIVYLLLGMTLVMYALVLALFPKVLRSGFYPAYSSLTFPMVISAVAMMRSYDYLLGEGYDVVALSYLGDVAEVLAVIVVLGVLVMYVYHFILRENLASVHAALSR